MYIRQLSYKVVFQADLSGKEDLQDFSEAAEGAVVDVKWPDYRAGSVGAEEDQQKFNSSQLQ